MKLIEQLQQLAELAAQATAGPWTHWIESNTVFHGLAIKNKPSTYSPAELQICQTDSMDEQFEGVEAHPIEDAAFIAAARNVFTPENLALLTAALAPQWVAVTEQLPEDKQYVLLCDKKGAVKLGKFLPANEVAPDAAISVEGRFCSLNWFTHWMPLPAVPATTMERSAAND